MRVPLGSSKSAFDPTYVALALTALLWSSNFVIGRAMRDDVSPATMNFLRWAIALVILVPVTLSDLRAHRALLARHWKLIGLLGFTGIAAFQTLCYVALTMTTALNTILLLSLAPLAIVALSWLALGERVTRRQAAGLGTSLAGAAVLILQGDLATLVDLRFNAGDLWMLLAIGIWAVYSVLLRRRPAGMPPLALHTTSVAAGTLCMLPAYGVASHARERPAEQSRGMGGHRVRRDLLFGVRACDVGARCRDDRSESRRRLHSPDAAFRRGAGDHVPRRAARDLSRHRCGARVVRRRPDEPDVALNVKTRTGTCAP